MDMVLKRRQSSEVDDKKVEQKKGWKANRGRERERINIINKKKRKKINIKIIKRCCHIKFFLMG